MKKKEWEALVTSMRDLEKKNFKLLECQWEKKVEKSSYVRCEKEEKKSCEALTKSL
jgi:hypothetical protein